MHASSTRIRLLSSVALLGALAFAPSALAQPAADPNRDTARRLAIEGVAAHGRADWPTVIDRFEHAEQLFHAPIHLRYLAIAYERATPPQMVRAAETWQRLSSEQLAADAPEVFRNAVTEARREVERLDGRLGHLVVDLPADLQGATVTLDGQPFPSSSFNTPRYVEPGAHTLHASLPGHPDFDRPLNIGPGATERVQIVAPHVEAPVVVAPPPPRTTTVLRPNPLRMVGIITAGVGGAALIGGAIAGAMASSEFDTLQRDCPNRVCTSQSALDRTGTVNTLSGASTGLLIGGGALVAAGVVLIIVGKPREETVQVAIGPRYVGLGFHF